MSFRVSVWRFSVLLCNFRECFALELWGQAKDLGHVRLQSSRIALNLDQLEKPIFDLLMHSARRSSHRSTSSHPPLQLIKLLNPIRCHIVWKSHLLHFEMLIIFLFVFYGLSRRFFFLLDINLRPRDNFVVKMVLLQSRQQSCEIK